ncbi:MAG: LpqN/LpqT family lipoprotein [Actinobacteria bacterium]|nr:LpqN/LpqT family lipoprotein [Actinomycetota bacterium]
MTQPRRAGGIAIAAIALGLGLAGCGSDTTTASTTTSAETTTSSEAAETTTSEAPATTPEASGASYTIADYIRDNGIAESAVHRGDPGTPTLDLPVPPGWRDAGAGTPAIAWGAIILDDPAAATDPPTVVAIMSRLTGDVDPAKIIEYAPGEIQNLPGYGHESDGKTTTLSGFDAYQIGGTYQRDGATRMIAQKTVVIPGQDGLYVLQLNAEGPESQLGPLMDATAAIDEQTTITP